MTDPRRDAPPIPTEQLASEAEITPQDERAADAAAQQFGNPLLRAMIDATPDDGNDQPPV